jgi:2-polyprenyl-3-methyl-5-hydroxy-6-metoxy-1,4-benzoquinol methylase
MVWLVLPAVADRYVLKDFPHSSHRTIVRWTGSVPARVLDVGAARGFLGELLRREGHTVIGIERDPEAAGLARPHYSTLYRADVEALEPISEAPFDVIIAGDVLEHLKDPPDVLRRLVAMLAPTGRIVATVPNVAFLLVRLGLLAGRFDYRNRGILDSTHLRFYTQRSFRAMVEGAGLRVTRSLGLPPPLPLVNAAFARWPARIALESWALAARVWPGLFAYQLAVEAMR